MSIHETYPDPSVAGLGVVRKAVTVGTGVAGDVARARAAWIRREANATVAESRATRRGRQWWERRSVSVKQVERLGRALRLNTAMYQSGSSSYLPEWMSEVGTKWLAHTWERAWQKSSADPAMARAIKDVDGFLRDTYPQAMASYDAARGQGASPGEAIKGIKQLFTRPEPVVSRNNAGAVAAAFPVSAAEAIRNDNQSLAAERPVEVDNHQAAPQHRL